MTSVKTTPGRHIMISGGSRGLGQAIVTALLDAGYRVSTFSRGPSPFTEKLAGDDRFFFATADLADGKSLSTFLRSAEAKFGLPYGLINCAAIAADGVLATMPEDRIRKIVSINVDGTLQFTRLVVRRMLQSKGGGAILNISSITTALQVFQFSLALARELGERNIRVNSIAPGYYDTEMSHSLTDQQKDQILRRTPLGRLGVPEDVVGSILFFLSDAASFITGQTLVIDGGSTI